MQLLKLFERSTAFCLLSVFVLGITIDSILGLNGINSPALPVPFKSKSLVAASQNQLAAGREQEATFTARLAILKQPLSSEALVALARSSADLKPQMSSETLTLAASLGWRDRVVQASVIEGAVLAKDWGTIAPRLLALAKLDGLDSINSSAFSGANVHDYAHEVASVFANHGLSWFKLIRWLQKNGYKDESMLLLEQTPSYDNEDECDQMAFVANELVRDGRIDFAARLVDSSCRNYLTSLSNGLYIDQHFGDNRRGPFEWHVISNPGVSYLTDLVNGGGTVEVLNADPLPRIFATKIIRRDDIYKGIGVFIRDLNRRGSSANPIKLRIKCPLWGVSEVYTSDTVLHSQKNCTFLRVELELQSGRFQLSSGELATVSH